MDRTKIEIIQAAINDKALKEHPTGLEYRDLEYILLAMQGGYGDMQWSGGSIRFGHYGCKMGCCPSEWNEEAEWLIGKRFEEQSPEMIDYIIAHLKP